MSFNQILKQGLIISFISKYSSIIVQLVVGMVLSRLLTPFEFGIFAIISVFIAFFNLLSNIGLGAAVIQSKEINLRDISNYFYLTIFLGIIFSTLFIALSIALVSFYSNGIYFKLGCLLTITIFFSSISVIPISILSKNKKFKEIGILNFSAALLSGIGSIILANRNFSYYSLVAQSIIYAFVLFFGSFILSRFSFFFKMRKISFKNFKISFKKIANYSSYNFAFNFINYFSRNLDNILVGKYLGQNQLGYYDKAYRLMLFPTASLNQVFSPIIHPLLSDYQDNREFIFKIFSHLVRLLALIGIPLTIFLYLNSDDIILILYGNQWLNSIPVFKTLSLTVWIQIIVSSTGAIFLASNRANLYFLNGLINAFIVISAITMGIFQKNLFQLSFYLMLAYYISSLITFYLVFISIFNKSMIVFLKILINPAIIGLTVWASIQISYLIECNGIFLRLIIRSVLSIFGFVSGAYITKEYQFLLQAIKRK